MVVFYRQEFAKDEKADKKPNEVTVIKTVKSANRTNEKYKKKADKKPNEKIYISKITQYLQTNEYITNKAARDMLNLADSTIKRIFKNMVDNNLIISLGERGQRKYALRK